VRKKAGGREWLVKAHSEGKGERERADRAKKG